VKIVEMGASLAHQGGASLFLYTALISINLAVLNALPLSPERVLSALPST
jgi:membrane-associated protease RseP (regulator of RpoE activity)